jgi:multidrug resistance efflux pump
MFQARRLIWLAGLLLLVGTVAGAAWALKQGRAEGTSAPGSASDTDATGILCIGFVDVEAHVAPLYPVQPGRVTWVWNEYDDKDKEIKAGTVLLKLDDTVAKADLTIAEAGLEEAKKELDKANLLPALQDKKIVQLGKAVEAAEHDTRAAKLIEDKLEKLHKDKLSSTEELEAQRELRKKAEALQAATRARVDEAKLQKKLFELDVARAQANKASKEALVAKAQKVLDEHEIRAPGPGTVLRTLVAKGETLGPNPRSAALEFCPKGERIIRAEVPQEWAAKVRGGQDALIEDDTTANVRW